MLCAHMHRGGQVRNLSHSFADNDTKIHGSHVQRCLNKNQYSRVALQHTCPIQKMDGTPVLFGQSEVCRRNAGQTVGRTAAAALGPAPAPCPGLPSTGRRCCSDDVGCAGPFVCSHLDGPLQFASAESSHHQGYWMQSCGVMQHPRLPMVHSSIPRMHRWGHASMQCFVWWCWDMRNHTNRWDRFRQIELKTLLY